MLRIQGGGFPHASHSKNAADSTMDQHTNARKKKGGRPRKAVKMDQLLGVKCSLIERKAIEARAKSVNLSVSEYLRKMGLTGKIDRNDKALPREVLQMTGTLNHLAANMNQIAYRRNRQDELNAIERAELLHDAFRIRQLAKDIKSYLQ
jgi:hypothetical protein